MDKRKYYQEAAVAREYEKLRVDSPSGRLAHAVELAAIQSTFRPQEKLIELACGTGRLLTSLRRQGWDVVGLDQSAAMLDAVASDSRQAVMLGDVFDLPAAARVYDGAYCFRFTNHYPDLEPFFGGCRRVLRRGGHLLFDSMRWSPLLWDSSRWGGRNHPVSDDRVRRGLERSGFRVESVSPLFPIGQYLLGSLPFGLARAALALKGALPARLQAVAAWHARRVD